MRKCHSKRVNGIIFLMFVLVLSSCDKLNSGRSIITGEATNISCRNATISGRANPPKTTSTDLTFGVLYSTDSGVLLGNAVQIQAKSFDSDYNFTVNTEVLEPETTYYYRSYISQNNEITYGDTKSFTTLPVSSMIKTEDATDISFYSATLNAALDLTDCKYDALEYGFEFATQGGQPVKVVANNLSGKAFSANAQALTHSTQYEVSAYVILDGRTYTAEKKSFKTGGIQASVSLNDPTNVKYASATISGNLSIESSGTFTKTATLYYSETATTLADLKSSGTSEALSLSADGTFSLVLTKLSGGTTYRCVVAATVEGISFESSVKSFSTETTLPSGSVDMGLSVKWASCNIGATKPEEYGDYYAWGETTTKSTYNWSTYTLCGGSETTMTKYCVSSTDGTVDNKAVLEKADDVAYQKLGGNWRMPTDAEWTELRNTNNCDWVWTTINGVNGRLVTSKKTGNSIFLPAAGYCSGRHLFNESSYGYYWSSSLSTGNCGGAWGVPFNSYDVGRYYIGLRYYGQSVRPVSE